VPGENTSFIRFGVFEVDLRARELRRQGSKVKLQDQPFQVLAMLLERPGQVVTRDELRARIWPDGVFVDFDKSLSKAINKIREALGDSPENSRFIETLAKRGYRFLVPVESGHPAKLRELPLPSVPDAGDVSLLRPRPQGTRPARETPQTTGEVRETKQEPVSDSVIIASIIKRHRKAAIGSVAVVTALVALVWFRPHPRTPKLTEKDTVVLADFTNITGDSVFDGTLRQGLSAQLQQSPFLNLLSDQRIWDTLALMGRPKDARLTQELGREVCERTASAVTVEGSISNLGSQYVLGLKAVNCRNGDLLAQEQVTANGKEQVLKALGDASTKLREKLGESLTSVQKYDAPLENVTTPSLEALHAYSLASQAMIVKGDYAGAIPFFQTAVSLDPNFAMAYARLGNDYTYLGETARAVENTRKAYELRGRTSEQENLYISSHYEDNVTGNLVAACTTYQLWAQTYPSDEIPRVNIIDMYVYLGEYGKTIAAVQEALKVNPGSALAQARLVQAYLVLNRLDYAKTTARAARAHNLDGPFIHRILYLVDFLQHDAAGMEREAAGLMGKPGWEDRMLYAESDTAAYGGEFAKTRELTRRAADSAQRADQIERAAEFKAEAAVREALVGNVALAKQEAQDALALANGKDVEALSAIALGLAGDSTQASRLAGDLGRRFPQDTVVRFEYEPMIHAAVAFLSGADGEAVEALAAAAPYELGQFGPSLDVALFPVYLRGEAYLAARQGAAARVEFEKILDHPGLVANEPIGALAHLGLGRAYALSGDSAKAKTAYQAFLALWKNADPDIPILQHAKAEYAKLK
jgi:eukaryotic-like serine/threonine-protein kinase